MNSFQMVAWMRYGTSFVSCFDKSRLRVMRTGPELCLFQPTRTSATRIVFKTDRRTVVKRAQNRVAISTPPRQWKATTTSSEQTDEISHRQSHGSRNRRLVLFAWFLSISSVRAIRNWASNRKRSPAIQGGTLILPPLYFFQRLIPDSGQEFPNLIRVPTFGLEHLSAPKGGPPRIMLIVGH